MATIFKALIRIIGLLAVASLGACGGVAKPPAAQVEPSSSADADDSAEHRQSALPGVPQAPPGDARRKIVPLDQMRGLTDAQITAMLGKPQFLRQDSVAELWQYRGDSCVLHLFLYRSQDELRVRHAEVRPRTVSDTPMKDDAAEACLTKLTAAPTAATS